MKLQLLTIALLVSIFSFSQHRQKSTYLELGGPGHVTVNYDTRFFKKQTGLGARIGLGWFQIKNDAQYVSTLSLPLEINHFTVIKKNILLELGAGLLYQKIQYNNKMSPIDSFSSNLSQYLDLAIRIYLPEKRFFIRASYTPLFHYPSQIGATIFAINNKSTAGIALGLNLGKQDD